MSNTSDVVAARQSISEAQPETASARLRLARQDLDVEAELVAHAVQELAAVVGDAAGFGGDRRERAHLGAAELGGADLERIERARRWPAPTGGRSGETPSPSRMMREKASMTRKPRRDGRASSRRQLLVPRSSAP